MKFTPINTGDSISGTYFGEAFTGIVTNSRWNTLNHQRRELHVKLDSPITVNGMTRESIAFSVFGDGMGEYGCRVDSLVSAAA